MPITRRRFLNACLAAGAFALTGCSPSSSVHRARWYLFGTLLDITAVETDGDKVERAFSELAPYLGTMSREWNAWKPGVLGAVNAAISRGESAPGDEQIRQLILGSQALYRQSGGFFNPAIGRAIGLWGFHDNTRPTGAPPPHAQIDRLLAEAPSPDDLSIRKGRLVSRNPAVQLDFGGYAKGYALDLGMELLKMAEVENAVINAGGDLCTVGGHGDRPWRIGIRHPQAQGSIAWLETQGREAVFTSGNYERYLDYAGRRYPHILDPRTAMPVDEIASATVVHSDGALADAAATALVVAGPERWPEAAAALGVTRAMVVDADGRVQLTRPMAARVSLTRVPPTAVTLV
jgi:thiamine biosynthesis lipoprotein